MTKALIVFVAIVIMSSVLCAWFFLSSKSSDHSKSLLIPNNSEPGMMALLEITNRLDKLQPIQEQQFVLLWHNDSIIVNKTRLLTFDAISWRRFCEMVLFSQNQKTNVFLNPYNEHKNRFAYTYEIMNYRDNDFRDVAVHATWKVRYVGVENSVRESEQGK